MTGYFNPRSQTGATTPRSVSSMPMFEFQSTLPNGSDNTSVVKNYEHSNFNPRSQTGATACPSSNCYKSVNFNPRSQTGATYFYVYKTQLQKFQSTLPNGSDGKHAQYRIQKSCKVSNNYLYILHITPFICISKHQSRIFSYHLSVRISLTFHVHLPFAPYITTAPTIFQLKWHITLFYNCIKLEF